MGGRTVTVRRVVILAVLLCAGCSGGSKKGDMARGPEAQSATPPPSVVSVNIFPDKPTRSDTLRCEATGSDPSGVQVTYLYRWTVNSADAPSGGDASLPPGPFKKGDSVVVTVTPTNGQVQGVPKASDPVIIGNSPPVVQSVMIQPVSPTVSDGVSAVATAADPDGDTVTLSYKWFRNNQEVTGQAASSLRLEGCKKGDEIFVAATASDGEAAGPPQLSDKVRISNSPPRITSSPPLSMGEDGVYSYQVVASDADNDRLTYSLTKSPQGMSIDGQSGLIRWVPTKSDSGAHDVDITVDDGDGGKAVQHYILNLSFP